MKKVFLIVFGAVFMVLGSCSTQNTAKIDGEWLITKAYDVNTVGGDKQAAIRFDGKGQVNGNASVNMFFGSYTAEGDSLKFGAMGMTRMMGSSMEMEDAITKALGNTATVKIENDEATVFDREGKAVMTLKRKK
ncbi:MAG: META domain-containing protein [Muribaculaceae bacterium]